MLVIRRLTRIYFLRKFFAYPIRLSLDTLRTLGLIRTIKILFSFLWIRLFPRTPERSLEDFIINKFGKQLYLLFFKDYTEKVWGKSPDEIPAEWGAQRIKGVSLGKAIAEAVKSLRSQKKAKEGIAQKGTETSLIEQFLYPKYGPGSLWEEVARQVETRGGRLYLHQDVRQIDTENGRIQSITTMNSQTGQTANWQGDYFFSTMPVQELIAGMGATAPLEVQKIAAGLQYRDFINVGILLKQLSTSDGKRLELKDNWIYIQERDVKVGRLMIYNNWGGGMINDPNTIWIGMEYFCNKVDAIWTESDEAIRSLAIRELEQMDLARREDVLDSTIRRMEKTYPAYFGTYNEFDKIRDFTDEFENLFLVGRNGMHKYNNADHSMLTAMVAVDNIVAGITSKTNIWAINTEQEYHEKKQRAEVPSTPPSDVSTAVRLKYPFLVEYLWKNRSNRIWWLTGIAIFLVQFVIFKFRFPFANYMPDSYSYLEAASNNADVNTWPVAYSKFLRLISVFTHSDKIVVGLQYMLIQLSTLLFLFSLLEPLPLYVANYISADSLFIGLSLLWLTTLIWIIYKPRPWLPVAHAVLLLACFVLRYNAIYYPFVALLAFLLSKQSWKLKIAAVALGVGLVSASFLYTSQKMKETTGQWQFSAFGGWQLANNALYMYEHIPAAQRGPIPARFAQLETMVRQHMDTLRKVKLTSDDSANSFFYLWSGRGPLIQYLDRQYKKDSTTPYFKRWASEGPLYTQYALYLIKRYPLQFVENFIWPNAIKYAAPPTEFLGQYNMGSDSVKKLAKDWFNYKSRKVQQHDKKKKDNFSATEWFPILGPLANILLIMGIIGVVFVGAIRWKEYGLVQLLAVILAFWLLNSAFSIFASPIVLRYQVFPLFVAIAVGAILIERIYQLARTG
jgi:protoporphyrinogen oxidase